MVGQSHSALYPSAVSVAELSAVLLVEACPYLTNQKLHFNFIDGRGGFFLLLLTYLSDFTLIFLALKKLCLTAFPISARI